MNNADCQKIGCEDYLTDDGEPAWCNEAGCPAIVAMKKCPKVTGMDKGERNEPKTSNRKRNIPL